MLKGRKRDAGMSLFGVLLALVVFAVIAAGGMEWLSDRARDEGDRLAAGQLAALSDAVAAWVVSDFPARLAAAPEDVPLAVVRAAGVLPPGFAQDGIDALGRRLRVLVRSPGAGALDVLVTHTVPAGDERLAIAGLRSVGGDARVGVVFPDEVPARLRGPTVVADIAGFRADFAGAPASYALGVLRRHDRQSVYGDFLYRGAVPGLPGANTMETTLDLGGNDLVAGGELAAETMTLDQDLEVGGGLTVTAELLVGGDADVTGAATVAGEVRTQSARVTGLLTADEATVTGQARAGSVVASGEVRGGSIGTAGAFTAGSGNVTGPLFAGSVSAPTVTASGAARVSSLRAGSVNTPGLNVTGSATVSGSVIAGSVRATSQLTAQDAGFSTLIVGICSGC